MSVSIPFRRDFDAPYGLSQQVSPLVRRVIAKNPGAFTFTGTGTYIIGRNDLAIIDPGPDMASHVEAILKAVKGQKVSHILVTHTHLDHSPAAAALKAATGAATYGFGPHGSGRPDDNNPAEEGADRLFMPDHKLGHGDILKGGDWTIEAVHTPGHTSNHLCYGLTQEKALFTGDHVMGWSTSVIVPPDGDMAAYMRSLNKLLTRDDRIYWPTHGLPIDQPKVFVEALIAHRQEREAQILACIKEGVGRIPDMVKIIYAEAPNYLHRAAGSSVLAHIIHLVESGRLDCDGPPGLNTFYKPGKLR